MNEHLTPEQIAKIKAGSCFYCHCRVSDVEHPDLVIKKCHRCSRLYIIDKKNKEEQDVKAS